jgi:molybdopterin/thiamine biosynthesis adenylyltransferase
LKIWVCPKAVIAAREISEINPFIKVVCYTEAINEQNIDSFFNKDGKIDLLIEECDTIETKLLARVAARKKQYTPYNGDK